MYGDASNDMEGIDLVSTGVYEANNKVSLFSWDGSSCPTASSRIPPERSNKWLDSFPSSRARRFRGSSLGTGSAENRSISTRTRRRQDSVIYQVSAVLLGYPDEQMLEVLPNWSPSPRLLRTSPSSQLLMRCRSGLPPRIWRTQSEYVQEYDLSRRHPCTCRTGLMVILAVAVRPFCV